MRKIVIRKAILYIGFCFLIAPIKSSVIESIHKEVPFSYIAFNLNANEGWNLNNEGDKGKSSLKGKLWSLDYTKGAKSISISPTRFSLSGTVEKFLIRK